MRPCAQRMTGRPPGAMATQHPSRISGRGRANVPGVQADAQHGWLATSLHTARSPPPLRTTSHGPCEHLDPLCYGRPLSCIARSSVSTIAPSQALLSCGLHRPTESFSPQQGTPTAQLAGENHSMPSLEAPVNVRAASAMLGPQPLQPLNAKEVSQGTLNKYAFLCILREPRTSLGT